jgi:hypothetical protein
MCRLRFEELTVHSHPSSEVIHANSQLAKAEQIHPQRVRF